VHIAAGVCHFVILLAKIPGIVPPGPEVDHSVPVRLPMVYEPAFRADSANRREQFAWMNMSQGVHFSFRDPDDWIVHRFVLLSFSSSISIASLSSRSPSAALQAPHDGP
jgi:hypothetical protein